MFDFIRLQFQMGKLTADQVRAFAPRWITEDQAAEVIAA